MAEEKKMTSAENGSVYEEGALKIQKLTRCRLYLPSLAVALVPDAWVPRMAPDWQVSRLSHSG